MADETTHEDPDAVEAGDAEAADAPPERVLPDHPGLRAPFERVENAHWEQSSGQDVAMLDPADWRAFAEAAKAAGFEMCVDLTVVDYLGVRRVRFDVVASLVSHTHNVRLRMRAPLGAEDPTIASLCPVYPGVNFFEREAYDMFGIVFTDHPDLTRILMPDDWEGYPLRKDFAVGSVPVQFKESHKVT